jgi:hypothetical protein
MLKTYLAAAFGLFAAATFAGCGETPHPPAGEQAARDPSTPASSDAETLSDAQIQALAEKQKVCPVTGEPLGSMGAPQPVSVTDSKGGRHTVLICCESCRDSLTEKPDEYLAKLDGAAQEKNAPAP